jgi:hypothetical protein
MKLSQHMVLDVSQKEEAQSPWLAQPVSPSALREEDTQAPSTQENPDRH